MKIITTMIALSAGLFVSSAFAEDATPGTKTGSDLLSRDYAETVASMEAAPKPAIVKTATTLRAGAILHSSDLTVEGGDETALDLFVGMQLKRAVYAGKKISINDVGPPTAVERNAIVSLEFSRGPLQITTAGRALDAGAVGEAVRVMNLSSKTILTAVVTGPNKAKTQ